MASCAVLARGGFEGKGLVRILEFTMRPPHATSNKEAGQPPKSQPGTVTRITAMQSTMSAFSFATTPTPAFLFSRSSTFSFSPHWQAQPASLQSHNQQHANIPDRCVSPFAPAGLLLPRVQLVRADRTGQPQNRSPDVQRSALTYLHPD